MALDTSEQFMQNKYISLDKPLWKFFTLWGVTLATEACLSFRGSFQQLQTAHVHIQAAMRSKVGTSSHLCCLPVNIHAGALCLKWTLEGMKACMMSRSFGISIVSFKAPLVRAERITGTSQLLLTTCCQDWLSNNGLVTGAWIELWKSVKIKIIVKLIWL